MKLLKNILLFTAILFVGVTAAVICFLVQAVNYQSYTYGKIEKEIPLEGDLQSVESVYEEVFAHCEPYIEEHVLVQIEGTYIFDESADDALRYREIVFSFYQYVDEKAEGGRICVIEAKVNMAEKRLDIYKFYGAGKASSVAGCAEMEREVFSAIEARIKRTPELRDGGHFTSWVDGEGDLVVLKL